MANPEHLKILKQGVEYWNKWREENRDVKPDLSGADLHGVHFCKEKFLNEDATVFHHLHGPDIPSEMIFVDLSEANLRGADLSWENLSKTDLREANLRDLQMSNARLDEANLNSADLRGARLNAAHLYKADLRGACLAWADLSGAELAGADVSLADLRDANLIDVCINNAI